MLKISEFLRIKNARQFKLRISVSRNTCPAKFTTVEGQRFFQPCQRPRGSLQFLVCISKAAAATGNKTYHFTLSGSSKFLLTTKASAAERCPDERREERNLCVPADASRSARRREMCGLRSGPWSPGWSSRCPAGPGAAAGRAASAGPAGGRSWPTGT